MKGRVRFVAQTQDSSESDEDAFPFLPRRKAIGKTQQALPIEESDRPLDFRALPKSFTIKYDISQQMQLTSDFKLADKLLDWFGGEKDSSEEQKQQRNEKNKRDQKEHTVFTRYFASKEDRLQYVQCRKCRKYGHYQRNCPETTRIRCKYCLGKHSTYDCDQAPFDKGLITISRPVQGVQICSRCNRPNHKPSSCFYLAKRAENPYQTAQPLIPISPSQPPPQALPSICSNPTRPALLTDHLYP